MRPRVAVISAYFSLFDDQMPPDFRKRQQWFADQLRAAIETECEIAYSGPLIASEADGCNARVEISQARVDVLVFASIMAAPPSYVAAAIEDVSVPVVLWNPPPTARLGVDLDQARAHEQTTMLGALMLANLLVRTGRPFRAVTASTDDEQAMQTLFRTIRGFAAGSSLRGTTVLAVGDPPPGYLNIMADDSAFAELGVRPEPIDSIRLTSAFESVSESEIDQMRQHVAELGWTGSPHRSALQLASALGSLVDEHDVPCGTVNCHGPCLRQNPAIGIPACLAVSVSTSRGIPFSCTGDIPAAVALAVLRRLAGAVLYCEFYAPERATGTVLLANGGEGDTGLTDGLVRVVPSSHYPGLNGSGAALAFELPRGPVTIASLARVKTGWRLVWSLGELVESRYPGMAAPNAMFAFDAPNVLDRWLESGATHHQAVALGHLMSSSLLPRKGWAPSR